MAVWVVEEWSFDQ